MIAAWGPIITLAVTIVGILLKSWQDGQPRRVREDINESIQKGRADLVGGNPDAVTVRLSNVLDSGSNAGSAGSVPESGSADTVRRLAGLGIRNG